MNENLVIGTVVRCDGLITIISTPTGELACNIGLFHEVESGQRGPIFSARPSRIKPAVGEQVVCRLKPDGTVGVAARFYNWHLTRENFDRQRQQAVADLRVHFGH
jgi:hypothetical protein